MSPGLVEPPADPGPVTRLSHSALDPDPGRDPHPERTTEGSNFIHGLIGHSPGGFSETVRNSISSLTRRDHTAAPPPQPGADTATTMAMQREAGSIVEPSTGHRPRPLHLLTLPPEILLMIMQRLDFGDIVRLRETCKKLHRLAHPDEVRILFGGEDKLRMQLLSHCKKCLVYDPFRSRLLQPNLLDPGYPLASRCLDCAIKARDPRIRVGKKLNLANFDTVWVCRYCGYPITEGAAYAFQEMHRACYSRYNNRLLVYFFLGWLQLALGIVAAALAWKYYRNAVLVFAPTVTNFILLWACLSFIILRGNWLRTYHFTLVLELAILGLWIPPVYHIATEIANGSGAPVTKSTQTTLAMFALNMLFRLINFVGNIVLLFGFDATRRNHCGIPKWKLPFHYLATFLVFWTYPQSLEHKQSSDYV